LRCEEPEQDLTKGEVELATLPGSIEEKEKGILLAETGLTKGEGELATLSGSIEEREKGVLGTEASLGRAELAPQES
jgi:hypothetical protein